MLYDTGRDMKWLQHFNMLWFYGKTCQSVDDFMHMAGSVQFFMCMIRGSTKKVMKKKDFRIWSCDIDHLELVMSFREATQLQKQ